MKSIASTHQVERYVIHGEELRAGLAVLYGAEAAGRLAGDAQAADIALGQVGEENFERT